MEKFDSGKPLSKDEKHQALFTDLVRKLLTIDPEARPTAAEALDHPAMLYAANLTEADIKYPSS
jgi:serine/threonine protein kinase